MKTDKIKIELLSDMCVSDGGVYNSAIDTDICYDSYGLPYIPGKRLRGCLKECAQELNDWDENIPIDEMFGEKGNKRGKIIIYNAYLENREDYIKSIKNLPEVPLCHPQNILNKFSYIRTQTSINYETGVADEKTLRTMRVANKGLIFEADVEIHGDYIQLKRELEKCLAVFKHIGIARTRGYGEIHAFIPDKTHTDGLNKTEGIYKDNFKKCIDYKPGSTELQYEIYLKEPLICKSVNGQEENSLDYIEGNKILGFIGQMLKNNGKEDVFTKWLHEEDIYFSNAYLSVNNKRLYEVPASVFEIKNNKEHYRNKVYIGNEPVKKDSGGQVPECDYGLQLNQMKNKYVYIDKEGNMECHSVEMEIRYHHSRPKDKSVGRAAKFDNPESKFYQISSIKENQLFKGFIKGSADVIKNIYEYIKNNPVVLLGYGRNGEYGRCNIYVTDMLNKTKQEEKEIEKFYVLLKSPAIIYSHKAMYSTDVNDLIEEIFANIFVNGKPEDGKFINNITKYINITPIGGFNVTWGQRKPIIYGFDKGTVICIELNKRIKTRLGQFWVGERCMEGFGEAEVIEITDKGKYQGEIYNASNIFSGQDKNKKKTEKNILSDISKNPFLQEIADTLFDGFLRYKASVEANKLFHSQYSDVSLKPTVSNMLLICKEADKYKDSIDKIHSICQERFSKSSGTKDKKLSISKKILDHVCKEDSKENGAVCAMLEEFQEIYCIQGFEYKGKENFWNIKYLNELLIQLKYLIKKSKGDCYE